MRFSVFGIFRVGFLLFLSWTFAGCDSGPNEQDLDILDLSQPWIQASPEEVNIDPVGLSAAISDAGEIPRFQSLIVVRNGRLVAEEYFHGNHVDSLNDVRSVTKSVVSTLVGLALEEGYIESLDETLRDHLHHHVITVPPALHGITIRHLLTMTSGLEWDEWNSDSYSNWIRSEDHFRHVLDQPLVHAPGSQFTYNSGAVHLLGILLEEAIGMPLADFADQSLFGRIGIQSRRWEQLTRGYVNGGAGIDLRPRDLARLGQLHLQQGMSGDRQIVPAAWIDQVTRPQFEWRWIYGPLKEYTYGYLWWVEEGQIEDAFLAWGYGGQFIYVVPDLDLVVVATTNWRSVSQDVGSRALEQSVLSIIVDKIVPAARQASS